MGLIFSANNPRPDPAADLIVIATAGSVDVPAVRLSRRLFSCLELHCRATAWGLSLIRAADLIVIATAGSVDVPAVRLSRRLFSCLELHCRATAWGLSLIRAADLIVIATAGSVDVPTVRLSRRLFPHLGLPGNITIDHAITAGLAGSTSLFLTRLKPGSLS